MSLNPTATPFLPGSAALPSVRRGSQSCTEPVIGLGEDKPSPGFVALSSCFLLSPLYTSSKVILVSESSFHSEEGLISGTTHRRRAGSGRGQALPAEQRRSWTPAEGGEGLAERVHPQSSSIIPLIKCCTRLIPTSPSRRDEIHHHSSMPGTHRRDRIPCARYGGTLSPGLCSRQLCGESLFCFQDRFPHRCLRDDLVLTLADQLLRVSDRGG